MAITISITAAVPQSAGWVQLVHGTDEVTANWIARKGLNRKRAMIYGADGSFWATNDEAIASWYAAVNPASGNPALLRFALPETVLQGFLTQPRLALEHIGEAGGYQFFPECFETMNYYVTKNVTVTPISEINFNE